MSEISGYIEEAIDKFRSDKRRSAEIRLCEGIERVVGEISGELHGPGSSSISHLVHYTGTDVVFDMLDHSDEEEEGGLRLYDTVHGNDPEEGTFLLRHWPDREIEGPWMWQESANGDSGGGKGLELKKQVEQGLYPGHAYVLSFVPSACDEKNNDRIVFWREYGRQGAGCSLSIPEDKLFAAGKCSLVPYRVLYGGDRVETLAERLNECLLEPIETRIRSVEGSERMLFEAAQPKVQEELQLFRYLYKDIAYEHEKEYRLVILESKGGTDVKPKYEQKMNGRGETVFRHYMTHESLYSTQILGRKSQVILGPTVPHKENVEKTIDTLLHRKSISGTEITSSGIRYRGR